MSALSVLQSEIVVTVLEQVLKEHTATDRIYAQVFAKAPLNSEQKANITLAVGDILRRLNLYCYLADVELAQAANKATQLLGAWHLLAGKPQPILHKQALLDEADFTRRLNDAKASPLLWQGCPTWLDELGHQALAEQWPNERAALSERAQRFIRVNTLKTTREDLLNHLAQQGIASEAVPEVASAICIKDNAALFNTEAFRLGWFEQQDAGSQCIAPMLDVEQGMTVFDTCAGTGGKTLQLAALMKGKGRLVAMDVELWKLDKLQQRAKRAGAFNIETRLIESSKTIKRRKLSADRVLLDVPCSGIGVLKRKPLAKWHDTAERLAHLTALQQDILQRYSQLLKVSGIMIYATCSILPQENANQVAHFLANNPQYLLLEEQTISPSASGFDGFYWAKIVRTDI
ncbi:RsmB/NOP family class I SAM-dependent RNA methyltransferase [Motilimonas eburnea]|uniref:RsmB/NOP family class I SAM-dependent RNA methyltransferase n=1 Tax=Motilimonas eburnea TaxID=1737488 RepID=UPI001E401DC4|nr:methyltransferase domain-containing protein [Motilimonas eburnea]MCE2572865.1 methyltransferase domain-containing protein [Motilimonas eburnea]